MSVPSDPLEELGLLASALCDGQLAPDESARLEQLALESDEARRYLLDYVQLHGELYWQHAAAVREAAPEPLPGHTHPTVRRASSLAARLRRGPLGWLAHATAASLVLTTLGAGLLVVVLALWIVPLWQQHGGAPAGPGPLAAPAGHHGQQLPRFLKPPSPAGVYRKCEDASARASRCPGTSRHQLMCLC